MLIGLSTISQTSIGHGTRSVKVVAESRIAVFVLNSSYEKRYFNLAGLAV